MTKKKSKPNIGICTPIDTTASPGIIHLSRLIDVVFPNAGYIYLVTGKAACSWFKDDKRVRRCEFQTSKYASQASSLPARVLNFLCMQIEASYKVAKVGRKVDSWIFFKGADNLPLAVLAAKILRRKVMILMSGNFLHPTIASASDFPKIDSLLYNFSRLLSDRIILYSNLIKEWNLEPYRRKITITQRHFVDFTEFKFRNDFEQRDSLIGYIGRLSYEKGLFNFVEALPKTFVKQKDLKFVIVGNGKLEGPPHTSLHNNGLYNRVKVRAWIPHNEMPNCLAKLKLLVIPSYTEGLSNIMLEAMACGTPVLATSVGAIPDVIQDKETGFLLRDNSPECIAEGIVATLRDPDLKKVIINARNLVETKFRYENAVESWARMLSEIE